MRRDAAIARLAVIGTRAVRQILEHLAAAEMPIAKAALLLALESIPDPRAVEPVLDALAFDDSEVRVAAIRAARGLLSLPQGTRVLDRLTALALDPARPGAERAVALDALKVLPPRTVRPLLEKLRDDPSREVREVVAGVGCTRWKTRSPNWKKPLTGGWRAILKPSCTLWRALQAKRRCRRCIG